MAVPEPNDDANHSFAHLSAAHPEWKQVADSHRLIEEKLDVLYSLPIGEFRKVPYRPAPLSKKAPVEGEELIITRRDITVRDGAKVGLRIYQPRELDTGHLLFFNVHGGGWTTGSPESEEEQNRCITVRNRAVVVSVDYRLAPEFPFPYALNDSYDALQWTKANAKSFGADPGKIIVGGGSAGANVSAVLVQMARNEGIEGIIGQVLNIPVTCHPNHFPVTKYQYGSYRQNAFSPIVNASRMRLFWDYYLPSANADPRASPLLAPSLNGLPPALIQIAGMDPLRDEGFAYAKALKDNGVDVTVEVYPGLPHAFYTYANLKVSSDYVDAVVKWIDRFLPVSER